jgi:SAM-dependent methyltransferase
MLMNETLYWYENKLFPTYLRDGNACRFVQPIALHFCKGNGLDVGGGKWPLPGSTVIDLQNGGDAMALPDGLYDYVFSSHCLEHLENPVAALEHWKSRLKPSAALFLYLPHTDMIYWRTTRNRKHLHEWEPHQIEFIMRDLGFVNVIRSERDLAWSFAVVGFKP